MGTWVRAARRRSWHAAGHTVAQSLRQAVCSQCPPLESRGRREIGVYVNKCVRVWLCVCVCSWLLPHQKCQRCYAYLFIGSLLSPVVAQGDHLQSHLHNDNNRVTWSGCEYVSMRACVHVCVTGRTCLCAHSVLLSFALTNTFVHRCLLCSPVLT